MSYLRDRLISEHIKNNYPNASIVNYNDEKSGLEFYTADELASVDKDWFPLCCYKDPETEKVVYGGRSKVFHTYTEGETGAGKTTRFVMQSIRALSSLKDKPSFVIVDIHGEIIENLYPHLKSQGYAIKVLNCDDPSHSDTYNPFTEIVKDCLEKKELSNESINRIRRIAEIMQPIESDRDPIWDRGARAYTNGCILDKFEDLLNGDIPVNCMTIYNVIQNHYALRETLGNNFTSDLFSIQHYKEKSAKSLSTQKMISVTNNAEKTRASYYGVVENHYDNFGQPNLYTLSSNNTIDIPDFIEQPTVIVIQSGNTAIGDDLISLLVNDIYTAVVKAGKKSATKMLPRKIHCFLDEFANCNIAEGSEYIKMLTTSRKFGMYWHMLLQCDAQLERKFDAHIGKIIRANCTEIFIGSNDYDTTERFARSCGQKTIESLGSSVTQQAPYLSTVSLMTTDALNLTDEGYMYIKSSRHPIMKSYFEAFYNCPEFESLDNIEDAYPVNDFDYRTTAFYITDIPVKLTRDEFRVLDYIHRNSPTSRMIFDEFSSIDVKPIMRMLMSREFIKHEKNRTYCTCIPKNIYSLLKFRYYHDIVRPDDEELEDGNGYSKHGSGRNPFDFLDEDDVDYGDFAEEDDEDEDNSDDDGDEDDNEGGIRDEDIPKALSEIKDYAEDNKDSLDFDVLDALTLVPGFMEDAVLFYGEKNLRYSEYAIVEAFPSNERILKFEILEAFISNNDFSTKEEWDKAIEDECNTLRNAVIFPLSVDDIFEQARHELCDELTLGNILEIKKILSGNDN